MRQLLFAALITCSLFLSTGSAETTNLGRDLFNSKTLGSNNRSCNDCHHNGKKLAGIDDYDSVMLREIINFCIRDALKGEMLPLESPQLKALETYTRTLQNRSN